MSQDHAVAYLREDEAALYLSVSVGLLRKWRKLNIGPAFSRFTPRCVRYSVYELDFYALMTSAGGHDE
jgi:hypothetical protein